jgi:cytochrome c oxidase subunit 2
MNFSNLSSRTLAVLAGVAVVLLVGGFLIMSVLSRSVPPEASAEAVQTDGLLRVLLVIGGFIFLLVEGVLVYSIWRYRARPNDTEDGLSLHGNTTLEIVWTATPAVIVFLLTILSYQVFVNMEAPKPNEMIVHVDARRFNWAFTYDVTSDQLPSDVKVSDLPQGVQDTLQKDGKVSFTATELHTYVGRAMQLQMVPQDVIHAFWVPAFRLKQDVIPGRTTTVRFTPQEVPGETYPASYPLRCAELCGANHGMMVTSVIVHKDEADFKAWEDAEIKKVLFPPTDPVERGRGILASNVYPCFTCHVESDLGWNGNVGPSLNGVGDRAAGIRSTTTGQTAEEYLYTAIHNPQAYLVPGYGPLMPQLNIPECEARSIVAYLCTQTASGTPACKVTLPPECGSGAAASAESTAQPGAESTAQAGATAESTAATSAESTTIPAAPLTTIATAEATAAP